MGSLERLHTDCQGADRFQSRCQPAEHLRQNPVDGGSLLDHTEIAKELIDAKADVNVKDKKGNTALNLAAKKGHTEIANMIRARASMLKP